MAAQGTGSVRGTPTCGGARPAAHTHSRGLLGVGAPPNRSCLPCVLSKVLEKPGIGPILVLLNKEPPSELLERSLFVATKCTSAGALCARCTRRGHVLWWLHTARAQSRGWCTSSPREREMRRSWPSRTSKRAVKEPCLKNLLFLVAGRRWQSKLREWLHRSLRWQNP